MAADMGIEPPALLRELLPLGPGHAVKPPVLLGRLLTIAARLCLADLAEIDDVGQGASSQSGPIMRSGRTIESKSSALT